MGGAKEKMRKDGLSPLIGAFEEMTKVLQPYQDAVAAMQRNDHFANLLVDPLADRLGIMNNALTSGLFDDKLSRSVSEMFAPYHELTGMQSALTALGESFSPLIKTDFHQPMQLMADRMAGYPIDASGLTKALEPLADTTSLIGTSWMRVSNNWLVEKRVIPSYRISLQYPV